MFRLNRTSSPEPTVYSGPSVPVTVASEISPPASDGRSDVQVDEKKPESEVPSDVLIDILLEEILNDYSAGGPFVHRLKAYRTPSGEIVVREETIKIEVGTKLEMSSFANSQFYSLGFGSFGIDGENYDEIELSRYKSSMTQGDYSYNQSGSKQKITVGSKAVSTYFGKKMAYEFHVDGWELTVSSDGSISSRSKLSASSQSSQTINMDSDSDDCDDEDDLEMGRGPAGMGDKLAEMGEKLANMCEKMNVDTQNFSSGGGRQNNYSGNGTQFINTSTGRIVVPGNSMSFDKNGDLI